MLLPPGLCLLPGVYLGALLLVAAEILGEASYCQRQKVLVVEDPLVLYQGKSRNVSVVSRILRVIERPCLNIAGNGYGMMGG